MEDVYILILNDLDKIISIQYDNIKHNNKTFLNMMIVNKYFYNYIKNTSIKNKRIIKVKNKNVRNVIKLNNNCNLLWDIQSYYKHPINNNILQQLNNIVELDLNSNKIITNNGIKHLTNLEKLELCCCENITDDAIKGLTKLTELDLFSNDCITDDGIIPLINLNKLNLCSNDKITDKGISHLTNMTDLNISYNNSISYDGIVSLTNLKHLYIYYCSKFTDKQIKILSEKMEIDG